MAMYLLFAATWVIAILNHFGWVSECRAWVALNDRILALSVKQDQRITELEAQLEKKETCS